MELRFIQASAYLRKLNLVLSGSILSIHIYNLVLSDSLFSTCQFNKHTQTINTYCLKQKLQRSKVELILAVLVGFFRGLILLTQAIGCDLLSLNYTLSKNHMDLNIPILCVFSGQKGQFK